MVQGKLQANKIRGPLPLSAISAIQSNPRYVPLHMPPNNPCWASSYALQTIHSSKVGQRLFGGVCNDPTAGGMQSSHTANDIGQRSQWCLYCTLLTIHIQFPWHSNHLKRGQISPWWARAGCVLHRHPGGHRIE